MKFKKQKVDETIEASIGCASGEKSIHHHNIVNEGGRQNDDFFDKIPPGYKFCPTEEQLINAYLKKKIMNEPLPLNRISEVEVFENNPEQLCKKYKSWEEGEWYFLSPRDRVCPNGSRPKRSAQDGFWNSTGKPQSITSNGRVIGKWRTLVFHEGSRKVNTKTKWIMREYTLDGISHQRTDLADMKLDDWVLCKIYKNLKNYKNSAASQNICEDEGQSSNQGVDESFDFTAQQYDTNLLNNQSPEIFQPQLQHNNNVVTSSPELMGLHESLNLMEEPSSNSHNNNIHYWDRMISSLLEGDSNAAMPNQFFPLSEFMSQNNDICAIVPSDQNNLPSSFLEIPVEDMTKIDNYEILPEIQFNNLALTSDHALASESTPP